MLEQFLGRLHVLLLHLPIGILLLVALFEWLDHWKVVAVPGHVLTLTYGIGSVTAIITCITGYILSVNGDYTEGVVDNHMWAGIATAVIAILLFSISYKKENPNLRWWSIAMVLGIILTGHLGGTITHGEGFLTVVSGDDTYATKGPIFTVSTIDEAQMYGDLIQPILLSRCVGCHGPSKKKGKLRLDSEEFIRAGGKSGKDLIGKNPDESEMMHRMQLPMSDKKHMPPKNKGQITTDELQLIKWWIQRDSPFDMAAKELAGTDNAIHLLVERIISSSESNDIRNQSNVVPAALPDTDLKAPSDQILQDLMELDIVALRAGEESPFLELNFINVTKMTAQHWQAIEKVAPHIVRLKLSGMEIQDTDLLYISKMTNLMRLFLDETMITDDGLIHLSTLSFLEYLNINNTSITDTGINTLNPLGQLKIIYAFQTNITFSNLTNGVKIEKGGFYLPMLESDTTRIPQN